MRLIRAALVLATIGGTASAAPAATDESGLREAFERFQEAFLAADVATLGTLLTDDYVHTNGGSSPLGREAWLDWVGSRRKRVVAGTLVYDVYEVEDLRMRLRGNTAIVTGRARGSGTDGGEAFAVDVRFTQLWVLEDGVWRRAAFQDARVPGGDPADD